MENNIKTIDQLTAIEANIVRNAIGWDGTHYTDPKTGCVIEMVEGGFIVRIKADGEIEEAGVETTATEPTPTDAPVQETEPTAPAATEPTTDSVPTAPEVPSEPQDTTAPTPETGATGLGATPATDVPPATE